ncbi:MAG: hypothetical protein ACFCU4_05935 [Puniceicoccaceae bacterium]
MFTPNHLPPTKNPHSGFALVIALSLMTVVLLLFLSLATFLKVETSDAESRKVIVEARSNAILGLQMAIGQLQGAAGPDQRSTARADVFSELAGQEPLNGNQHWTGVWAPDDPSNIEELRSNKGKLLTWLVSGNEQIPLGESQNIEPSKFETTVDPLGNLASSEQVLMVGPGSADSAYPKGSPASNFVVVPKVRFDSQRSDSAFGYWVSDEAVKSKINTVANPLTASNSDTLDRRINFTAPAAFSVNLISPDTFSFFDASESTQVSALRAIFSRPQLSNLGSGVFRLPLREHFHDLGFYGFGLLTDSRRGGLKKDLTIAFELDEPDFRSSEFAQVITDRLDEWVTDNGGASNAKPIFNEIPTEAGAELQPGRSLNSSDLAVFRGPTWDLLRSHYRLYKDIANPASAPSVKARAHLPNQSTGGIWEDRPPAAVFLGGNDPKRKHHLHSAQRLDDFDAAVTDFDNRGLRRPRLSRSEIAPEMLRIMSTYSLIRGDDAVNGDGLRVAQLHIVAEFFVVLHNPYNVSLNVDGFALSAAHPSAFRTNIHLRPGRHDSISYGAFDDLIFLSNLMPRNTSIGSSFEQDGGSAGNLFNLVVTNDGTLNSAPITFLPGEIKVFEVAGDKPLPPDNSRITLLRAVDGLPSFSGGVLYEKIVSKDGGRPLHILLEDDPSTASKNEENQEVRAIWPVYDNLSGSLPPSDPVDHQGRIWTGMSTYLLDRGRGDFDTLVMLINDPTSISLVKDFFRKIDSLRAYSFHSDAFLGGRHQNSRSTSLPPTSFENRQYFLFQDFYLKASSPAEYYPFESFSHANFRAPVQRPEHGGGYGKNGTRAPWNWQMRNTVFESQPYGDLPNVDFENGRAKWGDGGIIADGFGQEFITLFETPTTPLHSLGSLQHAPTAIWFYEPTYVIGSSRAHPSITRSKIWDRVKSSRGSHFFWQFDTAYLSNEALWDGYFFSTVVSNWKTEPNGDSSNLEAQLAAIASGTSRPLHPRLKYWLPESKERADYLSEVADFSAYQSGLQTTKDALRPHNRMAAYLAVEGMFNINSTSVNAWSSFLGGVRDAAVDHFNDQRTIKTELLSEESPFSRLSLAGSDNSLNSFNYWNGFVSLTDQEIRNLATEIVNQIKLRAASHGSPFLSLSNFINRSLVESASDPENLGREGALQAAIDRTTINAPIDNNIGEEVGPEGSFLKIDQHPSMPAFDASGFWEGGAPLPDRRFSAFPETSHLSQHSAAGITQYLTQGDLLTQIGSLIAARSDTFIIRSYGSSNPTNGGQPAEVWCEAIVQRVPDFVDLENDPATAIDSPTLSTINLQLGRKFKVISFRWLDPSEV